MWEKIHYKGRRHPNDIPEVVAINCNPSGSGDAICCSWLYHGCLHKTPRVELYANGRKRQLLEMLGVRVLDSLPADHDSLSATWRADVEAGDKSNRLIVWADLFHLPHSFVRPPLTISAEAMDWARGIASERGKLIVISPTSATRAREWPYEYWSKLSLILKEQGFCVVSVGSDVPVGEDVRSGGSWDNMAAIMSVASGHVGIDSAPMHMAGVVGVTSVCLLGPTSEMVFGLYGNVHCIKMPKREMPCTGCWYQAPYYDHGACSEGCPSIANIRPRDVFSTLMDAMS